VTARAAGVLTAALTMLAVALSTGAAIYYLLFGMFGAMLLISLVTAITTLATVRVQCRAPKQQVTRGESVALQLYIRRYTLLPLSEITLFISSAMDEGALGRLSVSLGPLAGREYRYALSCPHRGKFQVGPTRVEVSDIFGLFTFRKPIRDALTTLDVHPRVYTMPHMMLDPGDLGPQTRIQMTEDAASPSDVRKWREGDVLKKVHWKLTMRKRELMVRTYEESARPDTLILLDVSPVNAIRSQALAIEDALCETALSMALAQLRADHPVRMPIAAAHPTELAGQSAADFARFMEAVVELRFDGGYPYEQLLMLETRRIERTGGVVLITSRMTAAIADIAMKMRRLGMRVLFLWITESARNETMELMTRMELGGVEARKINPWSDQAREGRNSA